MSRYYTSDLHLGHVRIIELCNRPFNNVDEMNEAIVENWNSTVSTGDTVFVLGDVALGKIDESLSLVSRLNGRKLLVPGNHDRCWSGNKKIRPVDITRYTDVGFEILTNDVICLNGWRLCHFPYRGDSHDEDRHIGYRPVRYDRMPWLLHGHVHEKWKVNEDQINVGVDVWDFTPVHEDQIREIVKDAGNS